MIALVDPKIESYAVEHTAEEPDLLRRLSAETHEKMELSQMLTGRLEGTFLRLLVRLVGARRVLEVGMFTGYSALMMAEALPEDGELITCEVNPKAQAMAQRYFDQSPHGHKIQVRLGPALETLKGLAPPFDLAFIDADKENYPNYYQRCLELLRPGGVIAADNVLWSGRVLDPQDEETRAIAALNQRVRRDGRTRRVDHALLPIRDGVMLAVKL
jgi:caffeoyl-CoA O-methyltransferase